MSYGIDLGSSALKVAGLRRTLNGWKVYAAARKRCRGTATPRAPGSAW